MILTQNAMVIKGVSKGIFLQDGFFIFFPRMCFHISLFQDGFSYFFPGWFFMSFSSRMVGGTGGNWKRPVNRMYTYNYQVNTYTYTCNYQVNMYMYMYNYQVNSEHVHVQLPGEHVHVH